MLRAFGGFLQSPWGGKKSGSRWELGHGNPGRGTSVGGEISFRFGEAVNFTHSSVSKAGIGGNRSFANRASDVQAIWVGALQVTVKIFGRFTRQVTKGMGARHSSKIRVISNTFQGQ